MQKVNLTANEFALMCVCECIGEDWDKTQKIVDAEDNGYEIELKVNGVELDFMEVMRLLHDNYEHMVEEKAKGIVKDQFEEIHQKAIDIIENLDYIKIKTD